MALVEPFVFQVVGYQNSGKTTVVSKLVSRLKSDGRNIAVIKHHGHGGKPAVPESKDSTQHLLAGADVSLVEGDGRLILQAEQPTWNLAEEIRIAQFFQPDLILVEGHKTASYPKLLLLRDVDDLELLEKVSGVVAVFVWQPELIEDVTQQNFRCFLIRDSAGMDWVVGYLKRHSDVNL